MRQKKIILQIFIVFLIASLLLFLVSKTTPVVMIQGLAEKALVPVQGMVFYLAHIPFENPADELKKLRDENNTLKSELAKKDILEKDNKAFRDQFQTKEIETMTLLPVDVIGTNADLPGTEPTQFTLDKGESEGVKKGLTVIYKNFLLGIISRTSRELSVVTLVTDTDTSLTARTTQTNALGILKGKNGEMLLDQVILSDTLQINDTVLSRGDIKSDGTGYRPDLLVGKIIAVQKKPSSLFQTAQIQPLIKFSSLRMVFVMVGK